MLAACLACAAAIVAPVALHPDPAFGGWAGQLASMAVVFGTGRAWWLVSFLGIHAFPAVLVTLGVAPVPAILASAAPLGPADAAAIALAVGAVALEHVADEQPRAFRRGGGAGNLETGLWRWSRHPNYLGEILWWWSLVAMAAAAEVTALLVFVSIPMMEERKLARRPGYADCQRSTSMLLPWPPRS